MPPGSRRPTAAPQLRARGLAASLADRTVLRGVDLDVAPGSVGALLAPSGAGKSTLLRCLVALVPITAGSVELGGADVRGLPATELRRRVGLVAQTPAMLPGTVADNLAYGLPRLDVGERDAALQAAGLDAGFAPRTARELSGGERARVAVARALTRQPEVLLLDEPTAALDADAAERLGATLESLARGGLAVLVATHDQRWATAWAATHVTLPAAGDPR